MGYLAATVSAAVLLMRLPWAPDLMAVALIALLVAGIRNAWDMTVWFVMRSNASPAILAIRPLNCESSEALKRSYRVPAS